MTNRTTRKTARPTTPKIEMASKSARKSKRPVDGHRRPTRKSVHKRTVKSAGGPRLYQQGEASLGICGECQQRVPTRYEYRDMPLENPTTIALRVLVALCERDHIVSVPWQSNHLLRAARRREQQQLLVEARIEVRVSDVFVEYFRVIAAMLDAQEQALRAPLIRFYLHEAVSDPAVVQRARDILLEHEKEFGPANERISVRVPRHLRDSAISAAAAADIEDLSALIRGLISLAWEDVNRSRKTPRFSGLAAVAAALA